MAAHPAALAGEGPAAEEQVLAWRAALEPLLAEIGADGYGALTLDGRERPLVALRVATTVPLPAERLEALAAALAMPEPACLNYRDGARHIAKRAIIEDGRLTGILLAGEDAASGWLRAALRDGMPIRRPAPLDLRPPRHPAHRRRRAPPRPLQLLRRQRRRHRTGNQGREIAAQNPGNAQMRHVVRVVSDGGQADGWSGEWMSDSWQALNRHR